MSTKYYIDKDGDLWKLENESLYLLRLYPNCNCRKWSVSWESYNIDRIINLYHLKPITEDQFFMELL